MEENHAQKRGGGDREREISSTMVERGRVECIQREIERSTHRKK